MTPEAIRASGMDRGACRRRRSLGAALAENPDQGLIDAVSTHDGNRRLYALPQGNRLSPSTWSTA